MRISIIAIALTAIFASCEKGLNIEPTASISAERALLTESDVRVTLIGAYDGLQRATVLGGDIQVINELLGNTDNIRFTGTFAGLSDIAFLEMSAPNTFARDTWAAAYNTILRSNYVLSALDKVTSSQATKDRFEGEALFIRGVLYFELVKLFGKAWGDGDNNANPGVPIILAPTTAVTPGSYVSRNSVAQVYQRAIDDLTRAESLLPARNSFYATKAAAAAVLSRIALMQGDYATARDAANRVIESGIYSLTPSFAELWVINPNGTDFTTENVFGMKVTVQDGTNSLNTYFGTGIGSIPGTAGRSDCKILQAHIDKYEDGDFRGDFFQQVGSFTYTRKHLSRFGNVAYIRLAEMYLTRAEANFRLGTSVGNTPVDDINIIRNRVNLADLTTVTLNDILKERYLELAFEGERMADIKRTRGTADGIAWNSPLLILPIPQREIDVNSNLVQNEGY